MSNVQTIDKLLMTRSSGNVFADLGFEPGEAANLLIRTDRMIAIEKWSRASGLTQAAAAKVLGINQPRFNLVLKTKLQEFSIDALINIAAAAWIRFKLTQSKASPPKVG
jgi:predicted XRE-type DNA-binding protein